VAYKPSDKRNKAPANIDPDVTPIMNLMVVLIPLLISMAEFVKIALLEYAPPAIEEPSGEGDGGGSDNQNQQQDVKLNLTLNITEEALQVSLFGQTSGENFIEIANLPDGAYDFEALHKEFVRIRTDIIGPALGEEQTGIDEKSGLPIIVATYKFSDAASLKIAGKGDIPWQVLVSVLDESREYVDKSGEIRPLYPSPIMGMIQ